MGDVLTHAQVVPTLSEFGEFEEMTGGDANQNFTDYYEPGSKTPRKISYTGNYADITLTRAYVPGRDNLLLEWWQRRLAGLDLVSRKLVKQFRNGLGVIIGQQTYLVYVKDVATPDAKAGDNSIGMVKVVLVCEAVL